MKISILISNAGRRSGGPEVFEAQLVRSLASLDAKNEYHLLCIHPDAPDTIGVRQDNITYHILRPKWRPVSLALTVPFLNYRIQPDAFHAPVVPPPIPSRRFVFTLVCSTTIRHPEFYPPLIRMRLKYLLHRAVQRADLVLCVSEDVRNHVREAFDMPEDRLAVVPLGVSPSFRPLPDDEVRQFLQERYGLTSPYFVFSGRWEPRKNIVRILEAFARFKAESRSPHKFVLTGRRTWAAKEAFEVIQRWNLESEIVDLGPSPFSELPYVYRGAEALVYPSLWEGFGLPILEAMACGTPVITSNLASMPEIAGDAGLLVNPYSVDEIAAAMHSVAINHTQRDFMRLKGLQRARHFSWERTASQTLAAYGRLTGYDHMAELSNQTILSGGSNELRN